MDGGRRLLRALRGLGKPDSQSAFALAGPGIYTPPAAETTPHVARRSWRGRRAIGIALVRLAHTRHVGSTLAILFLLAAAIFGALRGGAYADLVAAHGTLPDILARAAGFPVRSVTIAGTRELTETEILAQSGVGPLNSLVFLDVAALRRRLKEVPLVKEASVSKLYPDRLSIEIEERQPTALWQKDGTIALVAADGASIDRLSDPRFQRLPLVVGEAANEHLAEYTAILDACGDLRDRIRAGIYVAGRRWTLKTDGGLDIDLPEKEPADAASRLAQLERDGHILEKDVISLDMRIPGRIAARLTADAAASHADALAKKNPKKKGATT